MTKYCVVFRDECDEHHSVDLTAESVDVSPLGLALYGPGKTLIAAFRHWERFVATDLAAAAELVAA